MRGIVQGGSGLGVDLGLTLIPVEWMDPIP